MPTRPVELSNSDSNLNRFSTAHSPRLIVARIDTLQEIEEEGMDLKLRPSLKALMSNRNKGQSSKDAPKVKAPASLPPPLPPPTDLGLQANPNLGRKRSVDELKEVRSYLRRPNSRRRAKGLKIKGLSP